MQMDQWSEFFHLQLTGIGKVIITKLRPECHPAPCRIGHGLIDTGLLHMPVILIWRKTVQQDPTILQIHILDLLVVHVCHVIRDLQNVRDRCGYIRGIRKQDQFDGLTATQLSVTVAGENQIHQLLPLFPGDLLSQLGEKLIEYDPVAVREIESFILADLRQTETIGHRWTQRPIIRKLMKKADAVPELDRPDVVVRVSVNGFIRREIRPIKLRHNHIDIIFQSLEIDDPVLSFQSSQQCAVSLARSSHRPDHITPCIRILVQIVQKIIILFRLLRHILLRPPPS